MFENFSGLDSMFSEDPKKQAQWAMILGLLGNQGGRGGRGFMQGLGQAGLLGMNQFERGRQGQQRALSQKQEAELRSMRMDQMKRQQADQDYEAKIAPQFFSPGITPLTPNDDQGYPMPSAAPKADLSGYGMALAAGRRPSLGMPYIREGMKDTTPISVKPGESLVNRQTYKPLFTAPEKQPDWKDPAYQEFMMRKAQAGKTTVSIDNKMGGTLGSELGKGTAAILDTGRSKAESAKEAIAQGHQILTALDSGGAYTGPAASVRLKGAQIAQIFGMNPDQEGINRTREVITGLANQTLNSRGLLKGQGQVTEYEQKTLEKAKSGTIDDLTADEIRTVVKVNERIGRAQIAAHGKLVGALAKKPEFSEAIPFYQIDEPPAYTKAQAGGLTPAEQLEYETLKKRFGR